MSRWRHVVVLVRPPRCGSRTREVEASGSTAGKMARSAIDRSRRDRRVQVGERGRRGRVGVVVGGDEHGLERGDRALVGRGDPLLQPPHLGGQGGLVAHRRRHPPQERRHLGARLGEAEDVVDEQEHVAPLLVPEVLRHRQRRSGRPAGARRAARSSGRTPARRSCMTSDSVISAMRSFPSRERSPTPANTESPPCSWATLLISSWMMTVLPTPAPPKMPDLAALRERGDEVDDLDPGLEHLDLGGLVLEGGRVAVDRVGCGSTSTGPLPSIGLAQDVEDAPQGHLAHRHGDRGAGVDGLDPAGQAVRRGHRHGSAPSCCPGAAGPRRSAAPGRRAGSRRR